MTDDLVKRLRSKTITHTDASVWMFEAADRIEQLAATNEELSNCVAVLEAKLERISEEWANAVYGDLENGVASLNAAAATDFYKRYPSISSFGETLDKIIYGEDDEDG